MSVAKKFLLGIGGAALMATGLASTANAQYVGAAAGSCDLYAREFAAVNAPRYGLFGWNSAYRHAYNDCITGGPTFVSQYPYANPGYSGPFSTLGSLVTAPVVAAANVAGAVVDAGTSLAGAALSAPAAVAYGTTSALAPVPEPEPVVSPTAAPVVVKNYRGTYETPVVEASADLTTTAALAAPAVDVDVVPAQNSPEWYAYCAAKYRSFNPDTGMYLAYSGTYRMCD